VGLAELRGKVWIADFIFTSCSGTCPRMTERMALLQTCLLDQLSPAERPRARLVTFTVDPERDTLENLRAYATHFSAENGFWLFLRGDRAAVQKLAVESFRLAAGNPGPAVEGVEEIIHSSKFVLVDPEGVIRGYYEGMPGESLEPLIEAALRLLREPQA
jgi:protein SCO1/2